MNAVLTSLLASCATLGFEPWSYMRDLLPSWPKHRVLELAPANWNVTREDPDVVARRDEPAPASVLDTGRDTPAQSSARGSAPMSIVAAGAGALRARAAGEPTGHSTHSTYGSRSNDASVSTGR